MKPVALDLYSEVLKNGLVKETDPDVLARKLICTIIHLAVAAEKLGMDDVNCLMENSYRLALRHCEFTPEKNALAVKKS